MDNIFKGIIIKESLENQDILQKVKIINIEIEEVTEDHKTPWVKQWTLCTVEIFEDHADEIAKELSESLDSKHNWYADFKNNFFHYIIFRNKVFKVFNSKPEGYKQAVKYGLLLGIPDYQLDFI